MHFIFTFPITGNPVRVFTVESFEQLDKSLADSLTWDMCKTEFSKSFFLAHQNFLPYEEDELTLTYLARPTHLFVLKTRKGGPGTPDIICGPDRVGVRASTKKPFDGYVFVMDHFHQEECRAGPEKFSDSRSIGITVPFMTKVDQMVKIQCFYMEADKRVTVPLSVSMITTQFREKSVSNAAMLVHSQKRQPKWRNRPLCDTWRKRFSSVSWECIEVEKKDTFGMLVHSCYVDNGFGDRVDILGPKGCGLDAVLLSTPEYDSSLRLATKAYHVFKYADRPVLQFQCQITLCLKYDGGCDGITPPKDCPSLPGEDGHHHHHGRRRK
ncbi:zona pellucida-like domain protein, partial [Ostertagia ostertagi]